MKNLLFVVVAFFALSAFAQTPPNTSLHAQGFRVGSDLAKECTTQSRDIYLATTRGSFPLDYIAGVEEGWAANRNSCQGDAIEDPGTSFSTRITCLRIGGISFGCFRLSDPDPKQPSGQGSE